MTLGPIILYLIMSLLKSKENVHSSSFVLRMIFLWILFFTLIVLVHSIPQSADNVDPQPIVNPDSSIAFQDALGDDKSSDALPPSQNSPFSDTDFSQNSIAAETGLSQDANTAGTDRSQPELVAEIDSSGILMADCTLAAPTDDLSDENSQILPRDNHKGYCPVEPTVPPLTKPNPPPPKPETPEVEPNPYLTPKPRLRSKPEISPEKPILQNKPSDDGNPCPSKDGNHDSATVHVTCGGPEAALKGYYSSESRWVVNCVPGKSSQLMLSSSKSSPLYIKIGPDTNSWIFFRITIYHRKTNHICKSC